MFCIGREWSGRGSGLVLVRISAVSQFRLLGLEELLGQRLGLIRVHGAQEQHHSIGGNHLKYGNLIDNSVFSNEGQAHQ